MRTNHISLDHDTHCGSKLYYSRKPNLEALTKPGCNLLRALQKLIPVVKDFYKFPFLLYYFSDSSFFDMPSVSSINCVQLLTLNSSIVGMKHISQLCSGSPTFTLLPSI